MNKLILSAFAMSLIFESCSSWGQTESIDDLLGSESQILQDLKGGQSATVTKFHQDESWNIEPEKVIIDLPRPIKGQGYSIIPWSELDPMEWLSIDKWVIERDIKDSTPDWKQRLRESEHKELMGKVLQCIGSCHVYRGINKSSVQHLSRIHEGDELVTGENSVAWIYMMDGSLMRVSPDSNISMQEINLSSKEIFVLARINHGHIFWHSRSRKEHPIVDEPETDSISIPLLVREANQEFFERSIYKNQNDKERLLEIMDLSDNAIKHQFKYLNELIISNNNSMNQSTKFMLVAPNSTIVSVNGSFDFLYLTGGNSYFKRRGDSENPLALYLRGYVSTEEQNISDSNWHEVSSNGRSTIEVENAPPTLRIIELLTRRIKTMELAREIWIKEFTLPLLARVDNAEKLASDFGYKLWGNDLEKRINFLLEYTRRIETTNLRSIENLLTKLEEKGETFRRDLSEDLYRASLNDYLLGLKSRYDNKNMRVREISDVKYYVWILKNGKF